MTRAVSSTQRIHVAFERGMRPGAERRAMGLRGRAWMERDSGWESVAARMLELYRWGAGQSPRPDYVTSR
jgi:hypothetical protein